MGTFFELWKDQAPLHLVKHVFLLLSPTGITYYKHFVNVGPIISFVKNWIEKLRKKVPNYYFDGKRKFCILHARLRNFCSYLNYDFHDKYLRDDPVCSCSRSNESAAHYFFECHLYDEQRLQFLPIQNNFILSMFICFRKAKTPCQILIIQNYFSRSRLYTCYRTIWLFDC